MRQVVISPGEDGFWVVEVPSLPGCISQGETKEKALNNIREAIEGYIEALEQDGLPVPEEKFETLVVANTVPALPVISGREAAKAFEKAGFRLVRQKGSHMILRRDPPFAQVTVPDHKVLDRGTLRSIIRQSGLSVEEFIRYL